MKACANWSVLCTYTVEFVQHFFVVVFFLITAESGFCKHSRYWILINEKYKTYFLTVYMGSTSTHTAPAHAMLSYNASQPAETSKLDPAPFAASLLQVWAILTL